jgi:hypothetical protein
MRIIVAEEVNYSQNDKNRQHYFICTDVIPKLEVLTSQHLKSPVRKGYTHYDHKLRCSWQDFNLFLTSFLLILVMSMYTPTLSPLSFSCIVHLWCQSIAHNAFANFLLFTRNTHFLPWSLLFLDYHQNRQLDPLRCCEVNGYQCFEGL